jgi:hypothetical protein
MDQSSDPVASVSSPPHLFHFSHEKCAQHINFLFAFARYNENEQEWARKTICRGTHRCYGRWWYSEGDRWEYLSIGLARSICSSTCASMNNRQMQILFLFLSIARGYFLDGMDGQCRLIRVPSMFNTKCQQDHSLNRFRLLRILIEMTSSIQQRENDTCRNINDEQVINTSEQLSQVSTSMCSIEVPSENTLTTRTMSSLYIGIVRSESVRDMTNGEHRACFTCHRRRDIARQETEMRSQVKNKRKIHLVFSLSLSLSLKPKQTWTNLLRANTSSIVEYINIDIDVVVVVFSDLMRKNLLKIDSLSFIRRHSRWATLLIAFKTHGRRAVSRVQ